MLRQVILASVAAVALCACEEATQPAVEATALFDNALLCATVEITPPSTTLTALGAAAQLEAEVRDVSGRVVSTPVTWTSDNAAVAPVDGSGLVTALENGQATITASCGAASGTAVVTVEQEVATVVVTPPSVAFAALGETSQLSATCFDANDYPVDATAGWASDEEAVATVTSSGLVEATGDGEATITATCGGVQGTAAVTVGQEVATVVVTPDAVEFLALGQTTTLIAQCLDGGGSVVNTTATWSSSNEAVATVTSSGLVEATGDGEATITATCGGETGTVTVTVGQVVTEVVVTPGSVVFGALGATEQLIAECRDAGGSVVNTTVAWSSSDNGVATVEAGLVEATGNGQATITAVCNGVQGTAEVTVEQVVHEVEVFPGSVMFETLGATALLSAECLDADGGVVNTTVAWWSSDNGVATVEAGLVEAMGYGEATITAACGGVQGTAEVTVEQVVHEVVVTPGSVTFHALGATEQLIAECRDADGYPVSASVRWSSDAPDVAGVSSSGRLEAIGNDQATITATCGGVPGTAEVTVERLVADIIVQPETQTLTDPNGSVQLSATALDAGGLTVVGTLFDWASSDEGVATVGDLGLVSATGNGTAVISATAGGVSGESVIMVITLPDRFDEIAALIQGLADLGMIGRGEANSAQRHLSNALRSIERGHNATALSKLQDLIDDLQDWIDDPDVPLTEVDGQPVIDAVQNLIDDLGG